MRSVLLVDDSKTARLFMTTRLSEVPDLEIVAVDSGEAAMAEMDGRTFDLVVTDLVMPGIDGIQLIRLFRQTHPMVPVILITGRGSESAAARALRAGAVNYIPKRELADSLVPVCSEVLQVNEGRRLKTEFERHESSRRSEFHIAPDLAIGRRLAEYLAQEAIIRGDWSGTIQTQIAITLRELLDNAIIHGCLEIPRKHIGSGRSAERIEIAAQARRSMMPYRDRNVHVVFEWNAERIQAVIADDGPGFAVSDLPDASDTAHVAEGGPRGVFLARKLMDHVSYNAAGNEVTIVRSLTCNSATRSPDDSATAESMAWSANV